jgi:hypothetical protein
MDDLSDQLIEQRIRNRLIEVCEWIVDYEKNPNIDPNGLINSWYDYFDGCNPSCTEPVYSPSESRRLMVVAEAMDNLCRVTPQTIPSDSNSLQAFFRLAEWQVLKKAVRSALKELQVRGRFSEDVEEIF